MAELSPEDAQAFREDLGLAEPGLDRVIRSSYELLGLISFLTAGEDECRAWTIRRGHARAAGRRRRSTPTSSAASSARRWWRSSDLVAAGSLAACREKGTLRLEGQGLRRAGRRRDQVQVQRLRRRCVANCPACGRAVALSRAHCLYCGAPLGAPRHRCGSGQPAADRPRAKGPRPRPGRSLAKRARGRSRRRSRSRATRPGCSPGAAGSISCAPRRPRRPRPRPSVCAPAARSRSWCPRPRCAPRPCRASRASARATACACDSAQGSSILAPGRRLPGRERADHARAPGPGGTRASSAPPRSTKASASTCTAAPPRRRSRSTRSTSRSASPRAARCSSSSRAGSKPPPKGARRDTGFARLPPVLGPARARAQGRRAVGGGLARRGRARRRRGARARARQPRAVPLLLRLPGGGGTRGASSRPPARRRARVTPCRATSASGCLLLLLAAAPLVAYAPAWHEGRLLAPGDGRGARPAAARRGLPRVAQRRGAVLERRDLLGHAAARLVSPGRPPPVDARARPLSPFTAFQALVLVSLGLDGPARVPLRTPAGRGARGGAHDRARLRARPLPGGAPRRHRDDRGRAGAAAAAARVREHDRRLGSRARAARGAGGGQRARAAVRVLGCGGLAALLLGARLLLAFLPKLARGQPLDRARLLAVGAALVAGVLLAAPQLRADARGAARGGKRRGAGTLSPRPRRSPAWRASSSATSPTRRRRSSRSRRFRCCAASRPCARPPRWWRWCCCCSPRAAERTCGARCRWRSTSRSPCSPASRSRSSGRRAASRAAPACGSSRSSRRWRPRRRCRSRPR